VTNLRNFGHQSVIVSRCTGHCCRTLPRNTTGCRRRHHQWAHINRCKASVNNTTYLWCIRQNNRTCLGQCCLLWHRGYCDCCPSEQLSKDWS